MATEEERNAELQENYRIVAALLACLVRGLKDTGEQVEVMDSFGVSTANIAKALGIAPISVRTTRHRQGARDYSEEEEKPADKREQEDQGPRQAMIAPV